MNHHQASGDVIKATIGGGNSGQIAVGKNNFQTQTVGVAKSKVTEADLAELGQMLADLRTKVASEAPSEKKDAALERVDELKEAITIERPDLTTMEYVANWFGRHIPGLAGAVMGVVVHPIVGKLVEATGDALVAEFRRRWAESR